MARYADDPEFRLVVLHATDGDGGEIAAGVPATVRPRGPGDVKRTSARGAPWAGLLTRATGAAFPTADLTGSRPTEHHRGSPRAVLGILSDSRPVVTLVLAAIKEQRSQRQVIFEPNATDEEWMRVLTREAWIIAWPPSESKRARLKDMFEGLA